ncbi:hypothetical protein FACS1894170_11970 [Planctomycetales bacterium]|nr:hypothetical protein FACS1894170_11970 [Planctomycetales bacterium]
METKYIKHLICFQTQAKLTADIYTHIDQQEQIDAINSLPGW